MTKEDHNQVFTEFSLRTTLHNPSQKYLDAQWALAVMTGVCNESPETLRKILDEEWESGGKQLFYQQKASRN